VIPRVDPQKGLHPGDMHENMYKVSDATARFGQSDQAKGEPTHGGVGKGFRGAGL